MQVEEHAARERARLEAEAADERGRLGGRLTILEEAAGTWDAGARRAVQSVGSDASDASGPDDEEGVQKRGWVGFDRTLTGPMFVVYLMFFVCQGCASGGKNFFVRTYIFICMCMSGCVCE